MGKIYKKKKCKLNNVGAPVRSNWGDARLIELKKRLNRAMSKQWQIQIGYAMYEKKWEKIYKQKIVLKNLL